MDRLDTTRTDVTTSPDIPHSSSSADFAIVGWLRNGGLGWVLCLIPLALFLWFSSMLGTVTAGGVIPFTYTWIPSLNVSLSFMVDGLGLLFALVVSGVGTLIILYAGGYMAGDPMIGRFFTYLFLFMFAMLGLVLADDIITMFVFWELTSITSYLLIGFKHNYQSSRNAAMQALLTTGAGGLALLAGLILIAVVGGSWDISVLNTQGDVLRESPLYGGMLVLIFLGAFTKSAQFPFSYWLPSAMAAPTPVSAYLHSATMVNAGIYLLARLNPALGGTTAWQVTLMLFGATTMIIGAYIAILQVDLKRILAFTTVSALGTMVMLIGIGGEYGMRALVVFFVVHSLYKGCLFMVAGAIDHEAGTRDINQLSHLFRLMPLTGGAAALAALSMSGMIPLYGFIGKEVIYEATVESYIAPLVVSIVAVASNVLMILSAGMVGFKPFYQSAPQEAPKKPHEAPASMWLGPVILAALSLALGVLPYSLEAFRLGSITQPLLVQSTGAVLGTVEDIKVYLIPESFGIVPALSALTIALGFGGYWFFFVRGQGVPQVFGTGVRDSLEYGPERAFNAAVDGMQALARWQTRVLQSGYLRYYLLIIVSTVTVLAGYALLFHGQLGPTIPIPILGETSLLFWVEIVTYMLILAGAGFMMIARSRLAAVAGLGIVGFGVAIVFTLNSAPDLAMTQFSIEILSVMLFVLVLYRLPIYSSVSKLSERIRDAIVAACAGLLMTLLVLAVNSYTLEPRLSPFFAETSYEEAKGRNVVNVILVDYRALDTLGEIAVIGIAALGILVLIKLRPGNGEKELEEGPVQGETDL